MRTLFKNILAVLLAAVITFQMAYQTFPVVNPTQAAVADYQGTNRIDSNNIFGSGTIPGSTVFNLGGSTGISLDGYQGIYAGANTFSAAPFSVDLLGKLTASGVTIKDSLGTTVIDGVGISSSTQFAFGEYSDTAAQSTNSTSFVDIPSFTISFTLARAARVYVYMTINLQNSGAGSTNAYSGAQMVLDGAQVGSGLVATGHWYLSGGVPIVYLSEIVGTSTIQSLAAGSHTLKGQFNTSNATYATSISSGSAAIKNIGYIVLGK